MEKRWKGVTVVVFVAAVVSGAMGQDVPACASSLMPCKDYLNSTSPPSTCCDPMRDAVKNQLPCLCELFKNTALFKALHINITQALELPEHCGIKQGLSVCQGTAPAPTTGGESRADRLAWTGASALLFFWASMVLGG